MSEHPDGSIPVKPAVANPCPECPFNRHVKPGTLGGSPVETYVGQICGPFIIACHMHLDFQDPTWRETTKYAQTPQCAGAAVMRANIGVDAHMPKSLPRAEKNTETVFADLAEFVVHHVPQFDVETVRKMLPLVTDSFVNEQIRRAQKGERP